MQGHHNKKTPEFMNDTAKSEDALLHDKDDAGTGAVRVNIVFLQ